MALIRVSWWGINLNKFWTAIFDKTTKFWNFCSLLLETPEHHNKIFPSIFLLSHNILHGKVEAKLKKKWKWHFPPNFVWNNYTAGKWELKETFCQNSLMHLFNGDRPIVQCNELGIFACFIPGIANHFPFSIENWFHAKSSFRQVVNVMIDRILACNNSKLKEGNVLAWNSYQVNYFYISFLTTCRMFLQPRRKVSEKFWKSCCTIPLQKLFGRRTKFPAEFHIFANAI